MTCVYRFSCAESHELFLHSFPSSNTGSSSPPFPLNTHWPTQESFSSGNNRWWLYDNILNKHIIRYFLLQLQTMEEKTTHDVDGELEELRASAEAGWSLLSISGIWTWCHVSQRSHTYCFICQRTCVLKGYLICYVSEHRLKRLQWQIWNPNYIMLFYN